MEDVHWRPNCQVVYGKIGVVLFVVRKKNEIFQSVTIAAD